MTPSPDMQEGSSSYGVGQHAKADFEAGFAAFREGRLGDAETSLRSALLEAPEHPDVLHLLGLVRYLQGHGAEAVELVRRAIDRFAANPSFHNSLGRILQEIGSLEDAEAAFRRSIALEPDYTDALWALGNLALLRKHPAEARSFFQRGYASRPNSSVLANSLGNTCFMLGFVDEAREWYRRAADLEPSNLAAQSNTLMVSHYDSAMSRTAIFEAHKAWGLSMASRVPRRNRPFANDRHPARRLKIGYVSADFREHPVGFFFESVAMSHDRAAVSVTLYSAVKVPDATTDRLRGAADQWHSVVGLSDEDAAKAIENDGIDILVDLAGHTAGNRLGIFAYRPAPVQATWIGYPDTTGLAAIDWRITDAICDPPAEADAYAVERLMRLPEGFLCFRPPPEAPEVVERSPNLPITFGSFNAFQKLAPETIALWAAVLESVADSRLIVKAGSLGEEETRERFVRTFSAHGIAPERLILFGFKQGRDNHLAAYGDVDIALDPTPYNGTTTTMEALWMGCPVITLKGERHVSRVSASLLARAGLSELVADTREGFVAIAGQLARDRPRLARLRATLRDRLTASPLLDGPRFTRHLEDAYRTMWRHFLEKRGPEGAGT